MSTESAFEAVRRFHDILLFISHEPVRTAYEISKRLHLPLSSTYLAIAEMERLNCLTRDENGYLLTGSRLLQIGMDAHQLRTPALQLLPLVRYLRDKTGETSFAAVLNERLCVGVTATGTTEQHVTFRPFQTFAKLHVQDCASPDGLLLIQVHGDAESGDGSQAEHPVSIHAMPLHVRSAGAIQNELHLCVATPGSRVKEDQNIHKCLQEVRTLFAQSHRPEPT